MLVLEIVAIILGFAFLIQGGDRLVDASVKIAARMRLPKAVIAATLVAGGTSAPEVATSFMAALQGHDHAALANALGSNLFNILAVGGLSLLLQPGGGLKALLPLWLLLTAITFGFSFILRNSHIHRTEALALLVGLAVFFWLSFQQKKEASTPVNEKPQGLSPWWWAGLATLTLSIGARVALWGALGLGQHMGWSERTVAITLLAAGTGLPELATSLVAAYKRHGDMALANIMGSNVINTLAIGGLTGSIFSLQIYPDFIGLDLRVLLTATLVLGSLFVISSTWARRGLGLILALSYILYIGYVTGA